MKFNLLIIIVAVVALVWFINKGQISAAISNMSASWHPPQTGT